MAQTIELAQDAHALRLSQERPARTRSGYPMLLVLLLTLVATIAGFAMLAGTDREALAITLLVVGMLDLHLRRDRLLSAPAQRGRGDAAVRRL